MKSHACKVNRHAADGRQDHFLANKMAIRLADNEQYCPHKVTAEQVSLQRQCKQRGAAQWSQRLGQDNRKLRQC